MTVTDSTPFAFPSPPKFLGALSSVSHPQEALSPSHQDHSWNLLIYLSLLMPLLCPGTSHKELHPLDYVYLFAGFTPSNGLRPPAERGCVVFTPYPWLPTQHVHLVGTVLSLIVILLISH